jgi:hypothetical protein
LQRQQTTPSFACKIGRNIQHIEDRTILQQQQHPPYQLSFFNQHLIATLLTSVGKRPKDPGLGGIPKMRVPWEEEEEEEEEARVLSSSNPSCNLSTLLLEILVLT